MAIRQPSGFLVRLTALYILPSSFHHHGLSLPRLGPHAGQRPNEHSIHREGSVRSVLILLGFGVVGALTGYVLGYAAAGASALASLAYQLLAARKRLGVGPLDEILANHDKWLVNEIKRTNIEALRIETEIKKLKAEQELEALGRQAQTVQKAE